MNIIINETDAAHGATKAYSNYLPYTAMFLTALLFSLSAPAYAKDYTRSCKATLSASAQTPGGTRLRGVQRSFQGKGTIGYYNPNEARRRARKNLNECVTQAWENRTGSSRPRQCTKSNQVYNYPFTGLHFGIQQALCVSNPGHENLIARINVSFDGKKGCPDNNSWEGTLSTNYRITCPTGEVEQNTDRPGYDYRHFNLPALGTSDQCRNRCINDSRCRAWTYVKPTRRNPPVCWLKSSVPSPRPSSCCVSGVKTYMH